MIVEIGDHLLHDSSLGDGSAFHSHSVSITRSLTESSPIGAAEIVTFGRVTKRTEHRFSIVRRAEENAEEAIAEWYAHDANIPFDSPLRITTSTRIITVNGNFVALGLAKRIGVALWFDYSYLGGIPTITDAEGADVSQTDRTYEAIAVAGAGNDVISLTRLQRASRVVITVAAGGGAYAHPIVLPTADRRTGDELQIKVVMPASDHPTLTFRPGTAVAPALETLTGVDDVAVTYQLLFIHTGTAWIHFDTRAV